MLARKFDQVIRPYLNRFIKHDEIKITLMNIKKLIFEKDYTLSNFFQLCQSHQLFSSPEMTLSKNLSTNQSHIRLLSPSTKNFNTSETNYTYREIIKIELLFKGLYAIGY